MSPFNIALFVLLVLVALTSAVPKHGKTGKLRKDIQQLHDNRRRDWEDVKKHPKKKFSEKIRGYMKHLSRIPPGQQKKKQGQTTKAPTTTQAPIVAAEHSKRMDIRLMSREQWKNFHEAVNALHRHIPDPAIPVSLYDVFTGYHRKSESPAAHFGPGFIPWHSVYVHSLENALKEVGGNVTIPVWDPRPDTEIPNHCDSCLYTAELLGNNQGKVTTGPFKGKKVYPEDCAVEFGPLLARDCRPEADLLYDYEEFNDVMKNNRRYEDFVNPYNEVFEENHGGLHDAVGGHIDILTCAPNDPAFYMLHSFVHAMFDLAMDKHYTPTQQLGMEYPTSGDIPPEHLASSPALPFEISLGQALKESMARHTQHTLVPDTCSNDDDCNPTGSDMNAFWCKTTSRRCASKIRIGGVCVDSSGTYPHKSCFRQSFCANEPTCSGGKCICETADGKIVSEPPTEEL